MGRLKAVLLLGISYATFLSQGLAAVAPSPEPSLEIFFPRQEASTQSTVSTTSASTISGIIQASLNNVLRIPPALWGAVVVPVTETPTLTPAQQQQQLSQAVQTAAGNLIAEQPQRQHGGSQSKPSQQQPQLIGAFRHPGEAQPASFLPDVNQAIHSTIAQLSTLSHWPFAYMTTSKPQPQRILPPMPTTRQTTTTPASTTTSTTTVKTTTTVPTTTPIPLLPPTQSSSSRQTQEMTSLPSFVKAMSPLYPAAAPLPKPLQSLPDRIHDRIHSTIGSYIRLPNLSQIGQPRPRPMLTEPPWVTELLGPTKEPPTTRAPTFGERIRNSVENVLLFVPATLLNFWYENWGTQHVDRFIHRLQVSTPKPGTPVEPVFATISQNGKNPFFNFTAASLPDSGNVSLPTIAAFINANGTLMPTIVHPVLNKTANTIEYQLRSDNETTILWTGTLSNDVFFGNKTFSAGDFKEIEDDEEDENIKNIALMNVKKE